MLSRFRGDKRSSTQLAWNAIGNYCQLITQCRTKSGLNKPQNRGSTRSSGMLLPPHPPSPSLPRAKLYRLFLQHLRFLPDPQVWITTVPRFRKLLETPGPSPSGSDPSHEDESRKLVEIREWRREKALKKAHKVRGILSVPHLPGLTPRYCYRSSTNYVRLLLVTLMPLLDC